MLVTTQQSNAHNNTTDDALNNATEDAHNNTIEKCFVE